MILWPSRSRIWPGSNGSIMPCCSAMRRIHRSLLMLIARPCAVPAIVGTAGNRSGRCAGSDAGDDGALDQPVVAEHDQREQQFIKAGGARGAVREQRRRSEERRVGKECR